MTIYQRDVQTFAEEHGCLNGDCTGCIGESKGGCIHPEHPANNQDVFPKEEAATCA